ncbi:hypothetical protein [Arsenicicoccus sp. oral taxon 190]|uniref:hypothetical protein n=1 Tax=Arsenicicoccus sp. oral taxon 190 TaxID=1658671 RepID=UPI00067A1F8B|nr:hypothetical protein [Arsenicicoccus sp. oral taxon 190]AKT51117.1 hypothetical protein ADJ73_06925 [Arsenicicoccus sp. oral taxon 190]
MRGERGHLAHLREQLDRLDRRSSDLVGALGWDIDVWLGRAVRSARAALDRPGLATDPEALARTTQILLRDLPGALAAAQDPGEPDVVRRRLQLASLLAALTAELGALARVDAAPTRGAASGQPRDQAVLGP